MKPTPEQLALAEKITAAARQPVTDLVAAMAMMKWPVHLQMATLRTMADEAIRAAGRVGIKTDGR